MNERSFAVVFGYLGNIDSLPRLAARSHLTQRVAFALDSARSFSPSMFFDRELFLLLLEWGVADVSFDSGRLVSKGEVPMSFASWEEFANKFRQLDTFDLDLESVEFALAGSLVALAELTCFTAVGGPHPYQDTFTLAVYLPSFDREASQDRLFAACARHRLFLRDLITASPVPKSSPWHRLLRFFT